MTSQVLVPSTLTSVPALIPAATAPIWTSKAPVATTMPSGKPSRAAHSAVKVPAGLSAVWAST